MSEVVKENPVVASDKKTFTSKANETIKYDMDGKEQSVILKRLKYGERNDAIRAAIGGKIKYVGDNKGTLEVDPFALREQILLKSIVQAPFPHKTIEDIKAIDPDLAEYLADEAEKLNPFR